MAEYYVPARDSETEFTEKRSRFIGHVWRVEQEEEAREKIAQMKAKRARDRARDEAARQAEAVASGEVTDWQQAQAEWEAWEKTQAEGSKKEGQSFGNTE